MVLVVLGVVLAVLEVVLVVLDLSWRSWKFTEASEVWVRMDWRPLIHLLSESRRGFQSRSPGAISRTRTL